jgi:hypothetical protein
LCRGSGLHNSRIVREGRLCRGSGLHNSRIAG